MKKIAFAFAVLLMALITGTSAIAQQGCRCPTPEQTRTIKICLGGVNVNVDVTFCTQFYAPPVADFPCNVPPRLINAWTKIIKICPQAGVVFPASDQTVIQAVLCALNVAGADALGYAPMVPATGALWRWTIVYPKCTIRDAAGCVTWCSEDICCTSRIDYRRLPASGQIVVVTEHPACPTPTCPIDCQTVACGLSVQNCPVCP